MVHVIYLVEAVADKDVQEVAAIHVEVGVVPIVVELVKELVDMDARGGVLME